MKSIAFISLLLLSTLLIACHDQEGTVEKNITVTIKNTDTYTYSFGILGLEDKGTVKAEPTHAILSELKVNGDGYLVYTYQPEAGYVGKDQTSIEICYSRGDGSCYATEVTTIKFTITD